MQYNKNKYNTIEVNLIEYNKNTIKINIMQCYKNKYNANIIKI